MVRKIIKIDKEKCIGCGLCINACYEGAIGMVSGKAKLLYDNYCDGLGNCLPVCPTNAISFEEREALEFNELAAKSNTEKKLVSGCPSTYSKSFNHKEDSYCQNKTQKTAPATQLNQWPVQIKLIPINAPYLENANLLIAADCVAYAYGNFHNEFMENKITIIGCPKLDECDYSGKLTTILKSNNINSITIVRMEVPCCSGIEKAVKIALQNNGKLIQCKIVIISIEGRILED